jgi:Rod binding domain-containing protein
MGDIALAPQGAPIPLQHAPAQGAQATSQSQQTDAVRRAAQEFESMFLAEMLAPMFEGLDTEGLGGGGLGEELFRPMLVERYAEAIAKAGGVGLADSIVGELTRLQTIAPTLEGEHGADR